LRVEPTTKRRVCVIIDRTKADHVHVDNRKSAFRVDEEVVKVKKTIC
jgi:hypothetical protein